MKLHDNALILSYCNITNICASINTNCSMEVQPQRTYIHKYTLEGAKKKIDEILFIMLDEKEGKKNAKKLEKLHGMTERLGDIEKESNKKREGGEEKETCLRSIDR